MRTPSTVNLRASRTSTPAPSAQQAPVLDVASSAAINHLLSTGAVRLNFLTGQLEVADASAIPQNLSNLPVGASAPAPTSRATPAKDIKPEDYAQSFLDFINENPTVFHAVGYFSKRLEKEGFEKLSERDRWEGKVKKGGKYYLTRNGSSLVAFTIPESYEVGNGVGEYSWVRMSHTETDCA